MSGFPLTSLAKLFISNLGGRSVDQGAADDFNQRIARNPFESGAGAGRRFAGTKSTRIVAVGATKKSVDAKSFAWFLRKVFQVCEGGLR